MNAARRVIDAVPDDSAEVAARRELDCCLDFFATTLANLSEPHGDANTRRHYMLVAVLAHDEALRGWR
jgi:hypothetical protein